MVSSRLLAVASMAVRPMAAASPNMTPLSSRLDSTLRARHRSAARTSRTAMNSSDQPADVRASRMLGVVRPRVTMLRQRRPFPPSDRGSARGYSRASVAKGDAARAVRRRKSRSAHDRFERRGNRVVRRSGSVSNFSASKMTNRARQPMISATYCATCTAVRARIPPASVHSRTAARTT